MRCCCTGLGAGACSDAGCWAADVAIYRAPSHNAQKRPTIAILWHLNPQHLSSSPPAPQSRHLPDVHAASSCLSTRPPGLWKPSKLTRLQGCVASPPARDRRTSVPDGLQSCSNLQHAHRSHSSADLKADPACEVYMVLHDSFQNSRD